MSLLQTLPTECECCPTTLEFLKSQEPKQTLVWRFGMWICPTCLDAEVKAQAEANTKDAQNKRIAEMNARMESNAKRETIELKEDIFNADTKAIVEWKAAIDADPAIPADKKAVALAELLHAHYTTNATLIFEARKLVIEKTNQQSAIQTRMNQLANFLKAEERAKYQLPDMSVKPSGKSRVKLPKPTKPAKPANPNSRSKSKFNLEEVKTLCKKHGVNPATTPAIKILMDSQGLTAEQAVLRLKR